MGEISDVGSHKSQASTIYKVPMVQVSEVKGMKLIKLSESSGVEGGPCKSTQVG